MKYSFFLKAAAVYILLSSVLFGSMQLTAQTPPPAQTAPADAGTTISDDFKKIGNDLKDSFNAAGESVGSWFKEQTDKQIEAAANRPGTQQKFGVVISVNAKNNTITVVSTEGKNVTFGITDATRILLQDTITGLQTPFTGGKKAQFRQIRKGDWLHYSYNLGNYIKSVLPDSSADTLAAVTVDILR